MMDPKIWIRISAAVTMLVLSLSLPRLFLVSVEASESDEPYEVSGSSQTVPGYNVFEVNNENELVEALSTTSYPGAEHPETNVYIQLVGNITIESEFTLHPSIDKLVIDGAGEYTLTERGFARTHVSADTEEVLLKDLTIAGNQYYGLFDNPYGTNVRYYYERITYTGPQLLWAFQSTAHFTDCDIHITGSGSPANEVAEVRDVFIYGNNQFRHNSPHSVFWLYNNGSLTLSEDAELRINALSDNGYILFTALSRSMLHLEDSASLHVEGASSQLAGGAGLYSIHLEHNAAFHWEANRSGASCIAVNNEGGEKNAIYLAQNAEFYIAPSGPVNEHLIQINGGNVVAGEGARLILQADSYTTNKAPVVLAGGASLSVGAAATMLMEISNSSTITYGLISFSGPAAGSFTIDRDAAVVIRGKRAAAAIYFQAINSSMEITDPDYLELAITDGRPLHFNAASPVNPCALTYTDVQQINYWDTVGNTYLNDGKPVQRWAAENERLSIKATISGNGNGSLFTELTGGSLDQAWNSTLDTSNFNWTDVRILSAGKIEMEVSYDGHTYGGRILVPDMCIPCRQGYAQLRTGRPGADTAVSSLTPATPEFSIIPDQSIGTDDPISVWGEYGYIFHYKQITASGGSLSLSAPAELKFGTHPVSFADIEISAHGIYALSVQDDRETSTDWLVMASFSGFTNMDKVLDSTLVLNDILLQKTPQYIASSSGNETVPLDISLIVPGGSADAGNYTGNITWTLVDAP